MYRLSWAPDHGETQTRKNYRQRCTNMSPPLDTEGKSQCLTKCRFGLRSCRTRKPILNLQAVTDKDRHPLENDENESGTRFSENCRMILQARTEGEKHHFHENILRHVTQALFDIRWDVDRNILDELKSRTSSEKLILMCWRIGRYCDHRHNNTCKLPGIRVPKCFSMVTGEVSQ